MGEFTVTLSEDDLYRGFLLNGSNRKVRPVMLHIMKLRSQNALGNAQMPREVFL